MRNIQDIKNRKKAITETAQITRAMELISVAKLNKLNTLLEANREYFNAVRGAVKDIVRKSRISHPYFADSLPKKSAYIVIASDKGLSGDYNRNILRFADGHIPDDGKGLLIPIGNEAAEFFSKRSILMENSFLNIGGYPKLNDARKLTAVLEDDFSHGIIDGVDIFYTDRKGGLPYPCHIRLLPISIKDFSAGTEEKSGYDFHYHPNMEEVLNLLVPQYLLGVVFSALIQSAAAEHFERIRTMHSATQNAEELMEKLNLKYNKLRQEAITTELAELSSMNTLGSKD